MSPKITHEVSQETLDFIQNLINNGALRLDLLTLSRNYGLMIEDLVFKAKENSKLYVPTQNPYVYVRMGERKSDKPQEEPKLGKVSTDVDIRGEIRKLVIRSLANPSDVVLLRAITALTKAYPTQTLTLEELQQLLEATIGSFVPIMVEVLTDQLDTDKHKIAAIKQEVVKRMDIEQIVNQLKEVI